MSGEKIMISLAVDIFSIVTGFFPVPESEN